MAKQNNVIFYSNNNWVVPANIVGNTVMVEVWGGGGGGGSNNRTTVAGGGGGGGAYSRNNVSVSAGNNLRIVVGTGGAGGQNGNNGANGTYSSFNNNQVSALGGIRGLRTGAGGAGANTSGNGETKYAGGSGNNGDGTLGGGGGAGAGNSNNGNNASGQTGGIGANGGGSGGNGGNSGQNGNNSSGIGAGGGGAGNNTGSVRAGGSGGNGRVVITWQENTLPNVVKTVYPVEQVIGNKKPEFLFIGTDDDEDDLEYQIQIDTSPDFDSQGSVLLFPREDFESGSLPASFDSCGVVWGSGSAIADDTSKISGTYSVRFGATGEVGAYALKALSKDSTEIYFQFKIFLPSDFAFGASNYFTLFSLYDSSDGTREYFTLENSGGNVLITLNGDSGYKNTGVYISRNAITTIEFYVKKDASTGVLKIWKDNTTEGSPDYDSGAINTGATAFRKTAVGICYAPEALTGYIYLDDIGFDTSFIGDRVGGPLIDVSSVDSPLMFRDTDDEEDDAPFTEGNEIGFTPENDLL